MTPKQRAARQHNGLMGHTAMIRRCAITIGGSPTTSGRAKELAAEIEILSIKLDHDLRAVRIDPKG